jgi:hypothetical protein
MKDPTDEGAASVLSMVKARRIGRYSPVII